MVSEREIDEVLSRHDDLPDDVVDVLERVRDESRGRSPEGIAEITGGDADRIRSGLSAFGFDDDAVDE